MRPRDVFERACREAITKLRQDIDAGVYHTTADNACADRLLKAWEKSMLERARYAERGLPAAVTSPQAAAARLKAVRSS